jgi:hypothetical protein
MLYADVNVEYPLPAKDDCSKIQFAMNDCAEIHSILCMMVGSKISLRTVRTNI